METPDSFRTGSERHFAAYLDDANLKWDYEPEIQSHTKRPDFRIWNGDVGLLSDIKERAPTEFVPGFRHVNPIEGIRKLIHTGRKKFKNFSDHICLLVLYNAGDHDTWLEPSCIFEAMLGDGGFTLQFCPGTGSADPDSMQSVFLPRGGEMITHYSTMEPHLSAQNISAVVALKPYRIPNPHFEQAFDEIANRHIVENGRQLTTDERCTLRCELILSGMPATIGDTHGLIVCDNPFAKHPLPPKMINGEFDERWSLVDGALARVFVGKERLALDPPENDSDGYLHCDDPNQ
jgi:hypothetical protein